MKLLKDILYKSGLETVLGSTNVVIESIEQDSRNVRKFSLFVAVKGTRVDGHNYIQQADKAGCAAVVCEELPNDINPEVTYVKVKNSQEALGVIASNFYDNPSAKLKLVGITGTNGKTTVATLLYHLFSNLDYKTGLISTVRNFVHKDEVKSTHTTPGAVQLNELLNDMVEAGCAFCFMEVSSHALEQQRVAGLEFAGAVFTNISHDHLDYHGSFDNYIKAKRKLFDELSSNAFALANKDDKNAGIMLQNTKAIKSTYALRSIADFKCKIIENRLDGLLLNIDHNEVLTRLIGEFNASNLLAVYSVARLLGHDKLSVLTAISNLHPVEGRFQYIKTDNNVIGIVDYAHSPDALKSILDNIQHLRTGNENVITLVGCGGDRDKQKRPEMAFIACEKSNKVILTSDNPRSENPDKIIDDMKTGVPWEHNKKVLSITNRTEAIKVACAMAQAGDIVLIAGKGHEKYQEINGIKYPFDDMEVLTENLKQTC